MKRIIISVMIFSLCLSGAVFELFSVSRSVNGYLEEIGTIDRLVYQNELSEAEQRCRELEDRWSETSRKIDAVLIHDYVDQIGISVAQMKAYIENGSKGMYFSSSEAAKKALESIKDSEYPVAENIL